MSQFVPEKYITVDDGLLNVGFTKVQINALDEPTRARFIDWTRQGNSKIETTLLEFSDGIPLSKTSQEYTYAKSAALNWVVYKKRDKEGSKNAANAKKDFEDDIGELKKFLIASRNTRTQTVSILGKNPATDALILLPSQIDTQFY